MLLADIREHIAYEIQSVGVKRTMMPNVSFTNLVIVAAIAFSVPLLLGFAPRLRLPATVLEILAGILLGPSVLGWVGVDTPIQILALIGVTFILFLAGLEIDFERLRGRPLLLAGVGSALSFGLALLLSYGLRAAGLIETPLFVAIVLTATALSVLVPLLKDTGQITTPFGQLVIAAATIVDFGTILLLSLLFSREATSMGTQIVLIGGFLLLGVVIALAVLRAERSARISSVLLRLQDTSAQIRVRGAFLLLGVFVALAERFGLETVLGAFIAGVILKIVDRDVMMTHPDFRHKLESVGFGVFIPFFFISSGLRFNLQALFAGPGALALVPVFLVALLIVRGVPAVLYRPLIGGRRAVAAGLLQATTLTFVVVATQIGGDLGIVSTATSAAFVAAALLSVLIFPLAALTILRRDEPAAEMVVHPLRSAR
jgi:Kef-type K+ transport system membrane component KefB